MATESETTEKKPVKKAPSKKAEPKVETPEVVEAPEVIESGEPVFTHERLIQECAPSVGHPPYVIAGALDGVTKKELTVSETAATCDEWLKAQVR
jgi:hypothetical protein